MKIGIIVEMFRQPLEQGIVRAKELGAEGIQIYAVSNYLNMLKDSPERIAEIKRLCDENGLAVSAVCADLGGHGFADLAGNRERIEKTKKILDASAVLGTKVLTTHIGVVPSDPQDPVYKGMVNILREIGSYAADRGFTLAIETGPETPELLLRFLQDIGVRGVGVNMDPANLVMVQNADPANAVRLLGKYIVHTHAKDGIQYRTCDAKRVYDAFAEGGFDQLIQETGELFAELPLGKGKVPWDRYLAALNDIGYEGFLTVERECGENPDRDIANAVSFLKEKLH